MPSRSAMSQIPWMGCRLIARRRSMDARAWSCEVSGAGVGAQVANDLPPPFEVHEELDVVRLPRPKEQSIRHDDAHTGPSMVSATPIDAVPIAHHAACARVRLLVDESP